jgi:hypothetical protein
MEESEMKRALVSAMVVALLAASATGWSDYVFKGTDGSMITGEDGSGKTFQNRTGTTDTIANSAWTILRGETLVVGGVTYLSDEYGKTILAGNDGTWAMNAVQLTAQRQFLSLTVYNNGADTSLFNVYIEEICLPGQQGNSTYSPHYAKSITTYGMGTLTSKSATIAAGASAVVTWDLFGVTDNGEMLDWFVYPEYMQDGARSTAPVRGDWLANFAVRVQIGGENTSDGLVTDVQLTGPSVAPEPATLLLFGTGAMGVLGCIRRRKMS